MCHQSAAQPCPGSQQGLLSCENKTQLQKVMPGWGAARTPALPPPTGESLEGDAPRSLPVSKLTTTSSRFLMSAQQTGAPK